MCGIAGILYGDRSTSVDQELLARMTNVLGHRGPDSGGFHRGPGLGLGHRRLAIIDPAAGQQPMADPDSQNVIVYNGEVYNYVELRAELESLGYRFVTDSDTEVILKAYDRWGQDCLGRFNGMWAFALWDARRQHLFLARDRLGIKPLHYFTDGSRFLFGSELKSLFAAGLPREPDPELLDVYLALGYIPAPHSFFRGMAKLKPGHFIVTDGARTAVTRYWDLPREDEAAMRTDREQVHAEFAYLLDDAVRISMRSDVPFGAFLSGGLDSASIVTLMAGQTPLPVQTFTIGFDEAGYDERVLARLVSAQVGTTHHEQVVEPGDLQGTLDQVCRHYDEPFGDSSAVPTGHVARLAAGHVKMVLTGDGGDEVLSGYPGYQAEKIAGAYAKVPGLARRALQSTLAGAAALARGRLRYGLNRYERLLRTATQPFAERLLGKAAWLDRAGRAAVLAGIRVTPVDEVITDLMKDCPWTDPFYRLMYFNFKVSLPDQMLTKVDRMTMAFSLEARVPFLDHRLVELMARVHKDVKLPGLTRKSVLRETVGRRLPPPLLRASKRGFVVPLRAWFRAGDFTAPLIGATSAGGGGTLSDWGISPVAVRDIVNRHRGGEQDYGNLLWMLLVLQRTLQN
ncbi:MAG: asparagine synthase (glutamine-hydrolyzing) [Chromatiales bacterium]|nr:asparagine synthase (glutamine-hydrolyzing) [Chromatiales bacterium]